ncbi:MAG: 2-hydroxychromene-2-carboxylate isomerase [Gemmobacter sp.]
MRRIDYYLTLVSPWCYLAGGRLEEAAARHGAAVTYRPVDPGQLFARTGGLPLGQRHESRQAYRLQELARWSAELGLPLSLHPRHFPTNPAPAAYAVIAAQAEGGAVGPLVHGFLRAVWAEDRDIADDGTIRAILDAHGFDPGLADRGLFVGAETYGRNLEAAVAAGVFGFPTYAVDDGALFWGQDRIAQLDRHLAAGAV